MGSWSIYSAQGVAKATAKSLEYTGNFMGETYVTATISSPSPINFVVGDYLIYRGERFVMNTTPSEMKQSSVGSYGEAFVYEDIKFDSLTNELINCQFLDIVRSDNQLHYTALPDFSFYAETIQDLADRIQVNLDRIYTGNDAWTVTVHTEYVNKTNVNISVSGMNCWDALALANSEFDANFVVRGRTITIGTNGTAIGTVFRYGKGNGLLSLQRTIDQDQAVITRLRAYGSTRNMPPHYYASVDPSLPNNYAVKNLMLPSFPSQTYDPYIDSANAENLGIREGAVFFDGSGDLEEIYPSLEGMTAEELIAAGIPCTATGNLDEVVSAEQIADDGIIEEGAEVQPFTITIKDIGFDINDYLTGETATISMKDGRCGGREFEITECVHNQDGSYTLTCNRQEDKDLDLWFPYSDYNISSGDKFVLLNIKMPDVYIQAASQKLLTAAQAYLAKNDYVRYTYEPKIDNIFVQREYDAAQDKTTTIYWKIKEGDLMLFQDNDLGIDGSVFIDTLSIKEGSSLIPEIEVTLREDKVVGTIERIQNTIDSIVAGGGQGNGGGGINASQARQIIMSYGADYFLSKTNNDTAAGNITFDKNIYVGGNVQSKNFTPDASGFGIVKDNDGAYHIETDYLKVRRKGFFKEVEVQDVYHVGGQMMLTSASATCDFVTEDIDSYRCYFRKTDGEGKNVKNLWRIGDQAYVNTFNLVNGQNVDSNHMLWRLVTGIDTADMSGTYTDADGNTYDLSEYHYIDLSKSDCATGSDAPMAGDSIVQLGYRNNDPSRESAIVIAGAGDASAVPYIYEFTGITSYNLPQPVIQISPNGNVFSGRVTMQSGSSIEDGALLDEFTYGKNNLLRNTGFVGTYAGKDLSGSTGMEGGTQMYSPSLEYWTASNVTIADSNESESGKEAVLANGSLSQTLYYPVRIAEDLVFSFKGKGTSVTFTVGGATQTVALSNDYNRRVVRFTTTEAGSTFSISGTGTICELQLERGTMAPASWAPSELDNRKELAEYQNLAYLKNAMNNGNTTVIGGLILSSVIQLGNYVNGQMRNVTAGMSGICNNSYDVSHWAGGTFEQAINTVLAYAGNPEYQPTEEEVANFAKFVVTHGGRAILNDVILRGYIYALGGVFRGTVYAQNGEFRGRVIASSGEFHGAVYASSGTFEGTITCRDGEIGGFQIRTDSQQAVLGYKTMILSPVNIIFTDSQYGVMAKFGSGSVADNPSAVGNLTNPLYIRVLGTTPNIQGIYLSVTGGTINDAAPGSGNSAISIANGKINGFRPGIRRVNTSQTLSTMDSVIINVSATVITLTLPADAEDGQVYWIKNYSIDGGTILSVASGSNHVINDGKSNSKTSWSHSTGEMIFVVYDGVNHVWHTGYFNCN